jgi:hypothetical protein
MQSPRNCLLVLYVMSKTRRSLWQKCLCNSPAWVRLAEQVALPGVDDDLLLSGALHATVHLVDACG